MATIKKKKKPLHKEKQKISNKTLFIFFVAPPPLSPQVQFFF